MITLLLLSRPYYSTKEFIEEIIYILFQITLFAHVVYLYNLDKQKNFNTKLRNEIGLSIIFITVLYYIIRFVIMTFELVKYMKKMLKTSKLKF